MFTYVQFNPVATEDTVLTLRVVGVFDGEVHLYDTNVAAIETVTESEAAALIASQPADIGCSVIDSAAFKAAAGESSQIQCIRQFVASRIAQRYTFADEIAIQRRAVDDPKRVAYEAYVAECVAYGDGLKAAMGYL